MKKTAILQISELGCRMSNLSKTLSSKAPQIRHPKSPIRHLLYLSLLFLAACQWELPAEKTLKVCQAPTSIVLTPVSGAVGSPGTYSIALGGNTSDIASMSWIWSGTLVTTKPGYYAYSSSFNTPGTYLVRAEIMTICGAKVVLESSLIISPVVSNSVAAGAKSWGVCELEYFFGWDNSLAAPWTAALSQAATEGLTAYNQAGTYLSIKPGSVGDIVFFFQPAAKFTNNELAIVKSEAVPSFPRRPVQYSIVLNAGYTWTSALMKAVTLRGVGHILGLSPSTDPTSVVYTGFSTTSLVSALSPSDLAAVKALYPGTCPQANTWLQRNDLSFASTAAREGDVVFTIGEKAYVCLSKSTTLSSLWEYAPLTDTWTPKANLPDYANGAPVFVVNNVAYLVCGTNLWTYAPDTDKWTKIGTAPGADRRAAFGFAINNKGYISGGFYNNNTVYEYDVAANSWKQKANMPDAVLSKNNDGIYRVTNARAFVLNNKGYMTGTNAYLAEYDPTTDIWKNTGIWANNLGAYPTGFSIGNRGYIFAQNKLYEYDPTTNSTTQKQTFTGQSVCYPVGFGVAGKGYIGLGGIFEANNCTGTTSKSMWQFTP